MGLADTLNAAYICLIDPRQYDIRDPSLLYVTVSDPQSVIKNQPPLGPGLYMDLYAAAKTRALSRVVQAQRFDLLQMAQRMLIDDRGRIVFQELADE